MVRVTSEGVGRRCCGWRNGRIDVVGIGRHQAGRVQAACTRNHSGTRGQRSTGVRSGCTRDGRSRSGLVDGQRTVDVGDRVVGVNPTLAVGDIRASVLDTGQRGNEGGVSRGINRAGGRCGPGDTGSWRRGERDRGNNRAVGNRSQRGGGNRDRGNPTRVDSQRTVDVGDRVVRVHSTRTTGDIRTRGRDTSQRRRRRCTRVNTTRGRGRPRRSSGRARSERDSRVTRRRRDRSR